MSEMDDLDELLTRMADKEPGDRTCTMHVDFLAKDDKQALFRAQQYAEALGILRTEIDFYQTRVSARSEVPASVQVYCREPGPHPMDICLQIHGHPGKHWGSGPTESWRDDDVPTAPDTIDGIERPRSPGESNE